MNRNSLRNTMDKLLPLIQSSRFKILVCYGILAILGTSASFSQDETPVDEAAELKKRKNIAVALNYCRASFHRIRKYPTQMVLEQEQQKILNNLNLNGIHNPEIISLYSDVLDEIGQIQLSDKEEELYDVKYKRAVRQELAFDSLSVGLDLLTAQYIGAAKTGANSWWDYRNFKWTRDNEVFKLEKTRVNSVVKKSSNFLDTFWRMTQQNNIPDRWLIRSSDLDDLEQAMNEDDPHVRLRILKRMEPFMECYPPYWYYLARTQQNLGELAESMETFHVVEEIGLGHFRRDDMMASALANRAVIQAHFGDADAFRTAERALGFSTQVWEANLACARILAQGGNLTAAEDAILRNLDVGLEQEQSTVTLLTFYYDTNNTTKLAAALADQPTLAMIPPPVLIRFASRLNEEETPGLVWTALASSMRMDPQLGFGKDDIILTCHPVWRLDRSKIALQVNGESILGEYSRQGEIDMVRFSGVGEFGNVLQKTAELPAVKLQMNYGSSDPIQLAFSNTALPGDTLAASEVTATNAAPRYHLIAAQWGNNNLAYVPQFPRTASIYETKSPLGNNVQLGEAAESSQEEIRSANQQDLKKDAEQQTTIK